MCLSWIAATLGSIFCGSNKQLILECAEVWYTFQAKVASKGNVEDEEEVLVSIIDNVGALIARTGGHFGRRQDKGVDDVVDAVSTTLLFLLF